jgi:hypothetical protein
MGRMKLAGQFGLYLIRCEIYQFDEKYEGLWPLDGKFGCLREDRYET